MDLDTDEIAGLVLGATMGRRVGANGKTRVLCPLCIFRVGKADRKSSLVVNSRTGWFGCWRCHAKGRIGDFDEALEADAVPDAPPAPPMVLPPGTYPLFAGPTAKSPSLDPFRAAVMKRPAASEATFARFEVSGCVRGPMTDRIILPVRDVLGVLRWYVGRTIHKHEEKKYLYPRGDRGGLMFNESALEVWTDTPALIVEGCFDAYIFGEDGVAVLGKPSPTMFDALSLSARPVVFVLDGDAHVTGWAMARRLRLAGIPAGSVKLPPCIDPDEIPVDVTRAAAAQALASPSAEAEIEIG